MVTRRRRSVLAVLAPCLAAALTACSSSTAGTGSNASSTPASGGTTTSGATSTGAAGSSGVGSSGASSGSSGSPTAGGSSATPASGGGSTSSGNSGTPSCTGAQLTTTGHFDNGGSAAGHQRAILVFTNTSSTACTLYGYPGVDGIPPYPGPGQVQHFTRSLRGPLGGLPAGVGKPTVTLAPGHAASAIAEASSVPSGGTNDCTPFQELKVTPPSTTATASVAVNTLPSCNPLIHPVVAGTAG